MLRISLSIAIALTLGGCNSTLSAYEAGLPPTDAPDTDGTVTDTATPPTGDDDDDDDVTTTDTGTEVTLPPGAIEISMDAVQPHYGTTAGGTRVTLTGGPFDNLVEVTFAGQPATIVSSNTNEVVLDTPAGTEGWVDVHAVSDDGNSVTPVQFQYWEDGVGEVGAVGAVEWYQYGGGYWADPQPQPYGFGQAFFTVPSNVGFGQAFFAQAVDTCTLNYAGANITVYEPGIAEIDLATPQGGGVPLYLDPMFPYFYWNSPFEATHAVNLTSGIIGSHFDLGSTAGSPDFPDLQLQGFTGDVPTDPPMVTSPAINGTNIPGVSRSFTLQWGGTPGDFVAVRMVRQTLVAGNWVDEEDVTCWLQDDGQHSIPNLWTAWDTSTGGVFFIVGRFNLPDPTATLEHNGSMSEVVGAHWLIGFAASQ